MTLQEKILYCRKKQSLSQEALAEKIGVSRQAISKWETGEATPEVSKLTLLAKTFEVSVDWLLSEEEPEEKADKNTAKNSAGSDYNYDSNYNYSNDTNDTNVESMFSRSNYNGRGMFAGIYRLIVKYSWIAGVYIALSGLLITGVGFGARVMFNTMIGATIESMDKMSDDMDGMMGFGFEEDYAEYNEQALDEFEDEVGDIFPGVVDDLRDDLNSAKNEYQNSVKDSDDPADSVTSAISSITNGFTLVIIIVGLVVMIGGIVLAIYLKVKSKKGKSIDGI